MADIDIYKINNLQLRISCSHDVAVKIANYFSAYIKNRWFHPLCRQKRWDEPVLFDFTGIDLEKVYQKLVKAFIAAGSETKKDFNELVASDASKKQLQNEIATLDKKIKQEKQFNRKVDLNKIFLEKKQQLKKIQEELR